MANQLTPLLAGCLSQMCGRVITAFPHDQHHSWPWIMTPGGSPGLGVFRGLPPGISCRQSMFGMRLLGFLLKAATWSYFGVSNLEA